MIYIYRFLVNIIIFFSPLILIIRLLKKKEDYKRFYEKFTFFSKKRVKGKLIWFHAVSVGELLSIIPLIRNLEKDKNIKQILITTSTLTSAKLFEKYDFSKTIHQFFPIDNNFFTKRFLKYWKPNLAIFVDSEIWPNMLINLEKKSITRILLNARISQKSFEKWNTLGAFSKKLFQIFNHTFPQNLESKKYLSKFGVKKIKFIGNLKFAQDEMNKNELKQKFKSFIKSKNVWCAVSTHPGEEKVCAEVHLKLIKKFKNLILIIIPRHIERVKDITKELSILEMKQHIHSDNSKINNKTKIYLVDTYGETKPFFDICKIVFVGKSLKLDGGQNPLEPARKNCSILHGPKVSNFREIYNFLDNQKISFAIKNNEEFYNKIVSLMKTRSSSKKIKNKINLIGTKILKNNLKEIMYLI